MMRITSIFFTLLVLVFTACSSDTEGEASLKSQQQWDNGDYEGIIRSLESKAERTYDENIELGTAYMSAVNLSSTDVTLMMYDSTKKSPSRAYSSESDAFAKFSQKIQDNLKSNPKALEYLEKAIESFEVAKLDGNETNSTQDVDLLLGTAQTAQATTVFSYLGDVSKLLENGVDYELLASSCAIFHVYSAPNIELLSNPTKECVESRIIVDADSTDAYRELLIVLDNGRAYRRLITLSGEHVILSDGYLDSDGNPTSDSGDGVNSPKPVEDERLTIQQALVISLNEGFDNILQSAPVELQDDILYFKLEIDTNNDGVITALEVSDYIDTQVSKYI